MSVIISFLILSPRCVIDSVTYCFFFSDKYFWNFLSFFTSSNEGKMTADLTQGNTPVVSFLTYHSWHFAWKFAYLVLICMWWNDFCQSQVRRVRPGTKSDQFFSWPDESLEEMDSTLAVQQYIQQTIRRDPTNIVDILNAPEGQVSLWSFILSLPLCDELAALDAFLPA